MQTIQAERQVPSHLLDSPNRGAPHGTKLAGRVTTVVNCLLMISLALFVGALIFRGLGGAFVTFLSGSMAPAYNTGETALIWPTNPDELATGDVVTYQPKDSPAITVTHRIVDIDRADGQTRTVTTRGDGNDADDAPIDPDQILGVVQWSFPQLGDAVAEVFNGQ